MSGSTRSPSALRSTILSGAILDENTLHSSTTTPSAAQRGDSGTFSRPRSRYLKHNRKSMRAYSVLLSLYLSCRSRTCKHVCVKTKLKLNCLVKCCTCCSACIRYRRSSSSMRLKQEYSVVKVLLREKMDWLVVVAGRDSVKLAFLDAELLRCRDFGAIRTPTMTSGH